MAAKNSTAEVIGIQKKSGKVTIPSTITVQGITFKVTAIAEKAFRNDKNLKSVVIGSNVKKSENRHLKNVKNFLLLHSKERKHRPLEKQPLKGSRKKQMFRLRAV